MTRKKGAVLLDATCFETDTMQGLLPFFELQKLLHEMHTQETVCLPNLDLKKKKKEYPCCHPETDIIIIRNVNHI